MAEKVTDSDRLQKISVTHLAPESSGFFTKVTDSDRYFRLTTLLEKTTNSPKTRVGGSTENIGHYRSLPTGRPCPCTPADGAA